MKYCFNLLALLFLFGCGSTESADTKEKVAIVEHPTSVRTANVQHEDIVLSIHASGQVSSENEAKPAFKTGGVVAKMYAEEGSFVKKGQLLASLDLTEINARVQQAEEALTKSKRDLQRAQNLYADSVATLENVQDAQTGFNVAEQNLQMAKFNQNYSEIRSPISGKVLKKLVNTGEIVGPGMPAYFILGNSKKDWVIKAGLSDKDWVRASVGDRAVVMFDAYPGEEFDAKVSKLADAGNPGSGTFDAELVLTGQSPRLAAGLIGSVEIFPKIKKGQTVIPLDALVESQNNEAKVFTIKEGKAVSLPVKIAFLHQNMVVVSTGLEGVETVVTDGAPYLSDGAKVKVIEKLGKN